MTDQNEATNSGEIIRATSRARLVLSVLLILILCFFLLCQFVAIPFLENALSTVSPSKVATVKTMLAAFACIATLAGVSAILYGWKIIRGRQYPPVHAWVWRDTPVRRGRSAIQFGWAHIVTGLLICAVGLSTAYYLWRLIEQSPPHLKLGENITILQQRSNVRP